MKLSEGFTLVEVMIIIAILGVLSAIAVPFTSDFVARSRLNSASRELYADLQALRRDAMTRMTADSARGYGIRFVSDRRYELFEFIEQAAPSPYQINSEYDGVNEGANVRPRDLPANLTISLSSGASPVGTVTLFDKQGLCRSSSWGLGNNTFVIRRSGETQGRCVRIALTRIREGVWNGSDCIPF